MTTISLRRLSDKTLAKYLEAESKGELTRRQELALASHRAIAGAVTLMRARALIENGMTATDALKQAAQEVGPSNG